MYAPAIKVLEDHSTNILRDGLLLVGAGELIQRGDADTQFLCHKLPAEKKSEENTESVFIS